MSEKVKVFSAQFWVFLSVFLFFFLLSLFFLRFGAERKVERVLFFPDKEGLTLYGERRRLPVRDSLKGNIELYIDELILGSVNINYYKLIPENVRLEALVLDDDKLYIGFSENLVTAVDDVPLSFEGVTDAVRHAVRFNFPKIRKVYTMVGGEPVGEM